VYDAVLLPCGFKVGDLFGADCCVFLDVALDHKAMTAPVGAQVWIYPNRSFITSMAAASASVMLLAIINGQEYNKMP